MEHGGNLSAIAEFTKRTWSLVLKTACDRFGFVSIHPRQGGNGRLHLCLIHHFLTPKFVFPKLASHKRPNKKRGILAIPIFLEIGYLG